jgi:hypothetical protein
MTSETAPARPRLPALIALSILGAATLAACGETVRTDLPQEPVRIATLPAPQADAEPTAAELLAGTWKQETPFQMRSNRQTFTIMNGEVEYAPDGTSEIEAVLVVDGQPDGRNTYELEMDSRWTLADGAMTETFTDVEVEPVGQSERAEDIALAVQKALDDAGPTPSTIVSLTDDALLREVGDLGQILYSRRRTQEARLRGSR